MLTGWTVAMMTTLATTAAAQQPPPQPSWQDLALRAHQSATADQMVANGIIAALEAENTDLKAQLAKAKAGSGTPPAPEVDPR